MTAANVERRKYKRFSATAFLSMPVTLNPLPPFFGSAVKGKMIDLSAGGLSLLIHEIIPQDSILNLSLTFPDHSKLNTIVCVRHVIPKGRLFMHGIEFLDPPMNMTERITKMSTDYIDCDTRIQTKAAEICKTNCAFFTMCTKEQRIDPVFDPKMSLEIAFQTLEKSPLLVETTNEGL